MYVFVLDILLTYKFRLQWNVGLLASHLEIIEISSNHLLLLKILVKFVLPSLDLLQI